MRIGGERKRSEWPREGPEPGRHYIVVNPARQILQIQVAVQASDKRRTHLGQQLRAALHDTAAHQDALWCRGEQHRMEQLCQRVGHGFPDWAGGWNLVTRNARTCRNCGPRGEPLDAIAVEAANAGPPVPGQPDNPNVTQLGVVTSKHRASADDQPNTDACANSDIRVVLQTACRSPASFGERRPVYIGVDCDRNRATGSQPPEDISAFPARLYRRGDMTEMARGRAQVERPEGCEAHGRDRTVLLLPAIECRIDPRECRVPLACGYAGLLAHVPGSGSQYAHAFGATELDTPQQRLQALITHEIGLAHFGHLR